LWSQFSIIIPSFWMDSNLLIYIVWYSVEETDLGGELLMS